jgi:hypothetical protein
MAPRVPDDLKPLVEAAKANGYKVVPSGRSKHMRVVDPKGKVVVDKNGPVIVSGSPGDFRARDMHVKRWIAAGIITAEQDPWRKDKGKPGVNGQPETRTEEQQRREALRLKGLAEMNQRRAERTRKIRSRWEPIIARLGGWDKRGMVTEAGLVLYHYVKSRGRTEAPKSQTAAGQLITRIKRGDTLSEDSAVCFEILLDHLESKPADLPRVWMNLVREARGLPALSEAAPAMTLEEEPEPEPEPPHDDGEPRPEPYQGLSVIERRQDTQVFGLPARVPKVALRALAEMMRGQPPDIDTEPLVEIATDILEMELGR